MTDDGVHRQTLRYLIHSWFYTTFYDPPSGWKYGFPKEFHPEHGETLEETLMRDKYPSHLLQYWRHTRFWEEERKNAGST
jgi:hypothetical protein